MARLTIRLDFDSGASIGPGKVRLLETIDRTHSIRKSAEEMGMSFRQAWLLLKAIEETFGEPVIATSRGGARGGGSALTALGHAVVARYRRLEAAAQLAGKTEMDALEASSRLARPASRGRRLPRKSPKPA